MNNIYELFTNVSHLPKPLSSEEQMVLIKKAKSGSKEAEDKILIHKIKIEKCKSRNVI